MRNFFKGLDMSFYGFNGTLFLKPHQEHCPLYESAAQYGGHLRDCTSGKQSGPLRELRTVCDPRGKYP